MANGKLGKFAHIFEMAEPVAKLVVPGGVGSVLDQVNAALNNGGIKGAIPDAVSKIAADNDDQTKAILALSHLVADLTARVAALEAK